MFSGSFTHQQSYLITRRCNIKHSRKIGGKTDETIDCRNRKALFGGKSDHRDIIAGDGVRIRDASSAEPRDDNRASGSGRDTDGDANVGTDTNNCNPRSGGYARAYRRSRTNGNPYAHGDSQTHADGHVDTGPNSHHCSRSRSYADAARTGPGGVDRTLRGDGRRQLDQQRRLDERCADG